MRFSAQLSSWPSHLASLASSPTLNIASHWHFSAHDQVEIDSVVEAISEQHSLQQSQLIPKPSDLTNAAAPGQLLTDACRTMHGPRMLLTNGTGPAGHRVVRTQIRSSSCMPRDNAADRHAPLHPHAHQAQKGDNLDLSLLSGRVSLML